MALTKTRGRPSFCKRRARRLHHETLEERAAIGSMLMSLPGLFSAGPAAFMETPERAAADATVTSLEQADAESPLAITVAPKLPRGTAQYADSRDETTVQEQTDDDATTRATESDTSDSVLLLQNDLEIDLNNQLDVRLDLDLLDILPKVWDDAATGNSRSSASNLSPSTLATGTISSPASVGDSSVGGVNSPTASPHLVAADLRSTPPPVIFVDGGAKGAAGNTNTATSTAIEHGTVTATSAPDSLPTPSTSHTSAGTLNPVLPQIISLGFDNGLDGWTVAESGGSAVGRGTVVAGSAVMTEGNSFLVTLERSFTIPQAPTTLTFSYTNLFFDETDPNFINDAFEATLVDSNGNPLVHSIGASRDAFFNVTENHQPALGPGTTIAPGATTTVATDISELLPGTDATLRFRLVNNDSDTQTTVTIIDAKVGGGSDDPPTVTAGLLNDTAPTGPGSTAFLSDLLTNDPTISGNATDDIAVSSLEASVDGGTFQDISTLLVGGQFSFDPGPLAPGLRSITIRATDGLGQSTDAVLDFTVNTPPVADAGGNRFVDEGDTVDFDAAGSSDADAPLFAFGWTFDDGSTASGATTSRLYPEDGVFPVTLEVTDTAGSIVGETVDVMVKNLAPLVTGIGDKQIDEGQSVAFSTDFSDPGVLDTHSALVDWGDGTAEPADLLELDGAGTVSGNHTYADDGTYDVTVTVTDDELAATSVSFKVTVANVAPTVLSAKDLSGNEGDDLDFEGTFSDPGIHDTHTATVTWSDGTSTPGQVTESGGQGTVTASHVFADNGVYPVLLEVSDNAGDIGNGNAIATIANVAPSLIAGLSFQPTAGPSDQQLAAVISGSFTDPGFDRPSAGTTESFTVTVDWGDGTVEPIAASVAQGSEGVLTSGTFSASHVYVQGGTYDATVTVEDDDGGSDSQSFSFGIARIDVVPSINLNSNGLIPVKVFSDPGFDVATIDVDSLRFGPGGVREAHGGLHGGGGGFVMTHFATQESGIRSTDSVAFLTGELLDGTPFVGMDTIRIVPQPGKNTNNAVETSSAPLGTKFFVVDAAADETFRYAPDGSKNGSFALDEVARNPRGATSNAAGDTVWIIDGTTHQVAVHGPDGSLSGSWLAMGLENPQGIATDGTDIWIVDAGTDEILRYAGAASLIEGVAINSQEFALHVENTGATGIATDGTTIWVSDDVADEVFVYQSGGDNLGRWQLDAANADAAGITNEPGGGENLWVVDRVDGLVYRYDGTASRTTGVASLQGTFPLSIGNLLPEGIADPLVTDAKAVTTQPPSVVVSSPVDGTSVGTGVVLVSGHALVDTSVATLVDVSVNNLPVEALDPSGNFFTQVEVKPGQNVFNLTATDSLGQKATTTLTLHGAQDSDGGIDFSLLSDVSASFIGEYWRTSFNEQADVLYAELMVRNDGQYSADVPLIVGISHISDPTVQVANADGVTPEGIPYYDLSSLVGSGTLSPGAVTVERDIAFLNPGRDQFTYDLVFLGKLNQAPRISTVPVVEALLGLPYSYAVGATDPDGDTITFSLPTAPVGMSIDSVTGVIQWAPGNADEGNHSVTIRVEDGRGASTDQEFVISAEQAPPNRAPIFASTPIVEAFVNASYSYDVNAKDADGDSLTFSTTRSPAGMSIDPLTGQLSWIPAPDQIGSHAVELGAGDGRGGLARQSFLVVVSEATGNRAPVIVTTPITQVPINTDRKFVFSDTEFADSDWTRTTQVLQGTPSFSETAVQALTDGDPGAHRAMTHTWGNGTQVIIFHVFQGMSYDPGTFGPIASIDYSEDQIMTQGLFNGTIGRGIVVEQGGAIYRSSPEGGFGNRTWQTWEVPALTEDDFTNLTTDQHPDFSSNGGPIQFGYWRSNTLHGTTFTVAHGIDNWELIVRTDPGFDYTYDVEAVDSDTDTLTFSLESAPQGMTIDPTTGIITWHDTASLEGSHSVKVQVEDGQGASDEQEFVLEVTASAEINGTKHQDLDADGTEDKTTVYSNDFEDSTDLLSEWSNTRTDTTPGTAQHPADRFLGQFGSGTVSLTLDSLPAHGSVSVSLDLFTIRSWDGNRAAFGGPDIWEIATNATGSLFRTTFANDASGTQAFPDEYPVGSNPGYTGAAEIDTLGYTFGGVARSAVYQLSFTFPHASDALTIDFTAINLSSLSDESWGLNDVEVEVLEGGVENWVIYVDDNRNARLDLNERFTLTDANGDYSLLVPPGDTVVRELPRQGWDSMSPVSGFHQVTLAAGEVAAGLDFVNIPNGDPSNRPPTITSTPATTTAAFQLYRYDIGAADPDGDALAFDLPLAPPGMAVHATLGVVVWEPTAAQIGTHDVLLRVQDGNGGIELQAFQVTVNQPNTAPIITSTAPVQAVAGLPYQYQVRAQDADGDVVSFRLDAAPVGMSVDPTTGLISWTPTATQVAAHQVIIAATDPHGAESIQAYTLDVLATAPNDPPFITSIPREKVRIGRSYFYQVEANDPNADPLSYSLDTAPAGMSIDTAGMVTWQPTSTQFGLNDVVVRVEDGRGGVAIQSFRVEVIAQDVNSAPSIVSVPRLTGTVGRLYKYNAVADDPDGDPVIWSLDQAPRGMSIDSRRGTIRWLPATDQLGPQTVIVRVHDSLFASTTQTFDVLVRAVNVPPGITSTPPTTASTNGLYTYAIRAVDPEGDPLTFSLAGAPSGMAIDATTGLIQWTPDDLQVGSHTVDTRVDDGQGGTASQVYTVVVSDVPTNRPALITSTPPLAATEALLYQYQVTAIDPEGDAPSYLLVLGPAGMSIDATTGLLQWTPALGQVGANSVTIAAVDAAGLGGSQSFTVNVAANVAPAINSSPVLSTTAGLLYRYDVRATDANGDPISFFLDTGPAGVQLDQFGRVSWPTSAGDTGVHPVTIRVSDDRGATSTQTFDITVLPDSTAPAVTLQVTSGSSLLLGTQPVVTIGAQVTLTVAATDNVGVNSRSLTIDGSPLALDSLGSTTLQMDTVGVFSFVGSATDTAGNNAQDTRSLRVIDPADGVGPFVEITSPAFDETVTYLTDIVGTVSDPALEFYRVEYAPVERVDLNQLAAPDPDFVTFAQGTTEVFDGVLGTFDPTVLRNDRYVIRVLAGDFSGNKHAEGIIINIADDAKLGNFRLELTDLSIPLAGIPIEIGRVYDTLQAGIEGDFGFGWTLAAQDADIRETVPVAPNEEVLGSFVANPFRLGTRVYLTNPEGRRVGFTFDPVPTVTLFGIAYKPRFTPDPGVFDRLEVGDATLSLQPDGTFRGFLFGLSYNPSGYRLITKEGLAYNYNQFVGLQQIVDRNGNTVAFVDSGVTHSSGESIQFIRDPRGRITEIVDPAGNSILYSYGPGGNLASVADQENLVTSYTYFDDPAHFLETIVDPRGTTVFSAQFDQDGRLISSADAVGNITQQDFDPTGFTGTFTDGNGHLTTITYDDRGNVLTTTDPLGGVTSFAYDGNDNEISVTDPRGFTTVRTFDVGGNVTSETNPLGHTTLFTYNNFDDVTSVTDALGRRSSLQYDGQGNLVTVVDALGDRTVQTYDTQGRLETVTDRRGNITTLFYNGGSLPSEVINPDGTGRLFEYNLFGQPTRVVDELGEETNTQYDKAGRVLSETRPEGQQTTFTYDGTLVASQTVQIDQTRSRTTTFEYDGTGQLERQIDAQGGVVQFSYDPAGNQTSITDPVGNTTVFVYDELNRLSQEIDPLGNVKTFGYDEAGNRTEIIDRNGRKRTFQYDANNRLEQEVWWTGSASVRTIDFIYDPAGNLLRESDPDSTLAFTYDALNRVTEVDNAGTPNLPHVILTSAYDQEGNRTSVQDNFGVEVASAYDSRNRLQSRTWQGPAIDPARIDFSYNVRGDQTEIQRFSDLAGTQPVGRTVLGYDRSGRVTDIKHLDALDQVLVDYDYMYDLADQLVEERHHGDTVQYTYDLLGQLLTADHTLLPDESYTYDANGNRTSSHLHGSGYVTGPGNQLLSDGTFQYDYDAEGNMILKTQIATGNVTEFLYDHRNRLIRVEERSAAGIMLSEVEFTYDVENRRIAKLVDGHTELFMHDGVNTWADFDSSGTVAARYIFGDSVDKIIARHRSGKVTMWYLVDRLGTIRDLSDSSGHLVNHVDYDSFGNVLGQADSIVGDRFLFTARELDAQSGLFFFRSRYYDSNVGRFLADDPLGFGGDDANLYRYASNAPVNARDPLGLITVFEFEVLIGPLFVGEISGSVEGFPSIQQGSAAIAGFFQGFAGTNLLFIAEVLESSTTGNDIRGNLDNVLSRIDAKVQAVAALLARLGDVNGPELTEGVPAAFVSGVKLELSFKIVIPFIDPIEGAATFTDTIGFVPGKDAALDRLRRIFG